MVRKVCPHYGLSPNIIDPVVTFSSLANPLFSTSRNGMAKTITFLSLCLLLEFLLFNLLATPLYRVNPVPKHFCKCSRTFSSLFERNRIYRTKANHHPLLIHLKAINEVTRTLWLDQKH